MSLYSSSDNWFGRAFWGTIIAIVALWILADIAAFISTDAALERFSEQAQTSEIEVVRQSNATPIIGDPHDVTFELEVEGKPMTGRCTSAAFSPMICRLYDPSGE